MTAPPLRYPDTDYAVEPFDRVEARLSGRFDGRQVEGVVTRIWPRKRAVTLRFADGYDPWRTTGNPRIKTVRVQIDRVDLIARDG